MRGTFTGWKILVKLQRHAGDYDNAIDYLVNVGGIAKEDDYEYLGQDDFCGKDFMSNSDNHSSKLIKVKVGSHCPAALLC